MNEEDAQAKMGMGHLRNVGCETGISGADGAGAQRLLFNHEVVGVD